MEDFVLIPKAAEELGISRQTLWRHVKRGHLKAKKVGRDYVIERADLAAFEATRQKEPGRPPKSAPLEYPQAAEHATGRLLRAAETPGEYRV
jgi:excisionase family DNA binding protein